MYRKWKESKDEEYAKIVKKQVEESKKVAAKDGITVPETIEEYCVKWAPPQQDDVLDEIDFSESPCSRAFSKLSSFQTTISGMTTTMTKRRRKMKDALITTMMMRTAGRGKTRLFSNFGHISLLFKILPPFLSS